MNSRPVLLGLALALLMVQCTKEETSVSEPQGNLDKLLTDVIISASPNGRFSHFVLASEYDLQHLPNQDPHNPITRAKVNLGQMIFFDPAFAQDAKDSACYETYSCATCHIPEAGFLPGRTQGIADGAHGFGFLGNRRNPLPQYLEEDLDAQGVRPLTVMNVAYMTNTLWSGVFGAHDVNAGTEEHWEGPLAEVNHLGFVGLESQNIEGVALHRMSVNEHVLDDYDYRQMFDAAFPEFEASERYSLETMSFALGAYLRSILTTRAPFQDWLKGDRSALTDDQKKGAMLFFDKARCYKCHNSPALSGMTFHALGTKDLYEQGGLNTSREDERNLGRGTFTGETEDFHRFKVPQLYNLKDYATFFHGSSKTSLDQVLDFKIKALSENSQVPQENISPLFQPIDLTQTEKTQLIDFLENALYDPDILRYAPVEVKSGHCFPNNDITSKGDLDCQ